MIVLDVGLELAKGDAVITVRVSCLEEGVRLLLNLIDGWSRLALHAFE